VANHPKTEIPTLFRLGYGAATRVFTNGTGQIEIRDLNNAPSVMKITRSEANLVIADLAVDPENTMRLENVPGASLSADKRTVTIPFATIEATGKPLFIVGGQETDVVRFDSGNVPNADLVPATGIHLNLGPEDDKITANWGGGLDEIDLSATQSSNAWLFNAFERGSVKLGNTGTVSFNSLDSAKGGSGQDIFTYSSTVIKRNLNYSDPYGSGQTGLQGGDGLDILLIQANADLYTWRKFSSMETSYLLLISTPGAFRAPSLSLRAPKGSKVLNGIESFEYTGGAGNNFIDARAFGAPMTLRGGGGNDTLWGTPFNDVITGGDGNDLISGGAGNDTIIGNAGRDILIGGLGADQLNDSSVPLTGSGDDILIGGRSTYEFNRTVLQAILATWTGPGSFVQRIHAIQITGVGPNKNYRFNSNTVTDDSAVDILFGGSNDDWFFAKTNAPNADTHDANPLEQLKVVSL
jgi:Ca2+-binding RTX toxin-like protein